MSQGEGGGRPRKHPHEPAVGQYAIDAEWQEIADEKSTEIIQRQQYIPYTTEAMITNAGEDNNRFVAIIMAVQEISKDADLNDVSTLKNCFDRYLEFCYKHNVIVTNMCAYLACGVSKQTISAWSLGQNRANGHPEYKEFADYVKQMCAANREQLAVEGKVNPIISIFHQKTHDGFDDRPANHMFLVDDEHVELSASEIAEKYAGIGDD